MSDHFISATLILALVCLSFRASLRLLYGARGPAVDDSVHLFIRILSWGLLLAPAGAVIAVTVGVLETVFGALTSPPGLGGPRTPQPEYVLGMGFFAVLFGAVVADAALELVLARRHIQRQAAWRAAMTWFADGPAAVDALEFHQGRFTGIVGRWFRRMIADLRRGVPWSQAVYDNRRAFPRHAPTQAGLMARNAGSTAPGDAWRGLDDFSNPAYQEVRHQVAQRTVYLALVLIVASSVLAYVLVRIVPSFQMIFADFDLELPAVTRFLIGSGAVVERYLAAPLALAGLLAALGAAVAGVCYLCDWPVLRPLIDRLTMFRHRARVLRLLALAIEQRRTIDDAFAHLAEGKGRYPSAPVRSRVAQARVDANAGQPWPDALRDAGLVTHRDAAVLAAAPAVGNLPWSMRLLADRKMRTALFRWSLANHVVFVAVITALSAAVLWIGVAIIVPIADLISNLSQ